MLVVYLLLPSLIQSSSENVSRNTLRCMVGYYYKHGQCLPCMSGCQVCSSKESCTTCFQGFYLVAGGICVRCSEDCQDCLSPSQCTVCNPGYGLSKNKCVQCESGCRDCKDSTCVLCFIGWHLVDGVCISNSVNCARYGDICFECNPGYFIGADGWCVACPTGCSACTNAKTCTVCEDWHWVRDNECVSCGGSCMTCGSTGCVLCYIGYHLENGVCVSNSLNCAIFDDVCSKCNPGYYLENGLCQACSEGCIECKSAKDCTVCDDWYWLNKKECVSCGGSCMTCGSTGCVLCNIGYHLDNGVCVSNSLNCEIFADVCLKCKSGYYLDNGICKACSEGCSDCTCSNNCKGCFNGYELTGQKCSKLKRNLREKYVGCPVGFYIHEGSCVQCVHPCLICNELFCSQCAEGFSLSEGSCI